MRKKEKKADLFIERSLTNALDFLKEAVFSEEIASSRGLLQSISPSVKIAALVIFLIATLLAKTLVSLTALYLLTILLAVLSGINIFSFIKRVWVFIPIFTLIIAIPAVFMQGPYPALLFVLRVTTCVSFAVAVTMTTKHNRLIKALASMGLPEMFVRALDMVYRYIFLFIKIFEEMHLSLKSRLIAPLDGKNARRWVASRIAFMFKRSLAMSEGVYMAMLARGYGMGTKK